MKSEFLLVIAVAVLVLLSGCPNGDNGGDNYSNSFNIQFFESDGSPSTGIEVEFAPNRGDWENEDFYGSKKFTVDSNGIISLSTSDIEYLFHGFSGGAEGTVNSKIIYNGEKIANSIYLYDVYWYGDDSSPEPLERIEVGCYQCDVENEKISKGETAKVIMEQIIRFIPVPHSEVFEIPGGDCPSYEVPEKDFALPEGCRLLEEPKEDWFFSYDLVCDSNLLLDLNCIYMETDDNGNYETTGAGRLVKTSLTEKTIIECGTPFYYFESEYIRVFDYHPGPLIGSFYIGYDESTKEIAEIRDWNALFEFLAPIDSAEKVWGGGSLASADSVYCYFKSQGYPPQPPEGYTYDEEVWTFEKFFVPKEEIRVSTVEAVEGGFKVHVLAEVQGCPCFIDYYEHDFHLSTEGKVTNEEFRHVYSAWEGCIC